MKAEWSIVVKESGGQCVMTVGIETMPWWCADSSDYPQKVRKYCGFILNNLLGHHYAFSDALVVRRIRLGVGPIILDDVECTGRESSLSECSHAGIRNHNCGHSEDVGVRCGEVKCGQLDM